MAKCLELTTAKVIYGRCMLVLTVMREVIELRYSKMLRDNDDERTRLADFGSINHKRPTVPLNGLRNDRRRDARDEDETRSRILS